MMWEESAQNGGHSNVVKLRLSMKTSNAKYITHCNTTSDVERHLSRRNPNDSTGSNIVTVATRVSH